MKYILYIFSFIALLLMGASSAMAASLLVEAPSVVPLGKPAVITIALESKAQHVNAIEGTVILPENFKVQSLGEGNSIVSMWVEHPAVTGSRIRFSGIIPGGYEGDAGNLFDIVGVFMKEGGAN